MSPLAAMPRVRAWVSLELAGCSRVGQRANVRGAGGVLGARAVSSGGRRGRPESVDVALGGHAGTGRDTVRALVMKGSPVRVRASAFPLFAGFHQAPLSPPL